VAITLDRSGLFQYEERLPIRLVTSRKPVSGQSIDLDSSVAQKRSFSLPIISFNRPYVPFLSWSFN
jgi:hypothetical protein